MVDSPDRCAIDLCDGCDRFDRPRIVLVLETVAIVAEQGDIHATCPYRIPYYSSSLYSARHHHGTCDPFCGAELTKVQLVGAGRRLSHTDWQWFVQIRSSGLNSQAV